MTAVTPRESRLVALRGRWHTGRPCPVHVNQATRQTDPKELVMQPDIHPAYNETTVTCSCGSTFTTRSTAKDGVIHAEVCSQCHPFYTGKQKILDTGGRIAKFEKRFGSKPADK